MVFVGEKEKEKDWAFISDVVVVVRMVDDLPYLQSITAVGWLLHVL